MSDSASSKTAGRVRKLGHRGVKPTIPMLRYWHRRFNVECFDGKLLPCDLTFGDSDLSWEGAPEAVNGLCYALEGPRVRIHLDSRVDTRVVMLATLLHEMVHQWQHENGHPMNHGLRFCNWRRRLLALTGLTI